MNMKTYAYYGDVRIHLRVKGKNQEDALEKLEKGEGVVDAIDYSNLDTECSFEIEVVGEV